MKMTNKEELLLHYRGQCALCTQCKILAQTRNKTVFGEGNPDARVFLVGEAAGREEDLQGRPFVGKAGRLLNNMIKACEWRREDVYICNVICCRPPNNRTPEATEIHNCGQFLQKQIAIVDPQVIICLGSVASNTLVGLPVSEARGRVHKFDKYPVVATWHPSYLLRKPEAKDEAWEDLQMAIEVLKNGHTVSSSI